MAENYTFSEEFLRRLESNDLDDATIQQFLAFTADEREQLATILIERKTRVARKNGDALI